MLPNNFYSPDLTGLRIDTYVFDELLATRIKPLANHLQTHDIDSKTYIPSWMMRLFVHTFPIEVSFFFFFFFFF